MTETSVPNTAEPEAPVEEVCRHAAALAENLPGPLRRVRVRAGATQVELEWPTAGEAVPAAAPPEPAAAPEHAAAVAPAAHHGSAAPGDAAEEGTRELCAPMVGTFYHAGEPGAPPFVRTDDHVEKGQQIGILEAMKLMNPIEAELSGRVVRVLVPDGTRVEFGQPLVLVRPDQD